MLPLDLWLIVSCYMSEASYTVLCSYYRMLDSEECWRYRAAIDEVSTTSIITSALASLTGWKSIYHSQLVVNEDIYPYSFVCVTGIVAWDRHDHAWLLLIGEAPLDLYSLGVYVHRVLYSRMWHEQGTIKGAVLLYLNYFNELYLFVYTPQRTRVLSLCFFVQDASYCPAMELLLVHTWENKLILYHVSFLEYLSLLEQPSDVVPLMYRTDVQLLSSQGVIVQVLLSYCDDSWLRRLSVIYVRASDGRVWHSQVIYGQWMLIAEDVSMMCAPINNGKEITLIKRISDNQLQLYSAQEQEVKLGIACDLILQDTPIFLRGQRLYDYQNYLNRDKANKRYYGVLLGK